MRINEIIRERRKALGLTQERVADYLGVSAPAVNKWEKGGAYPDITLLPPLARLLGVDLNTLLSFEEDLSEAEVARIMNGVGETVRSEGYGAGFAQAMEKVRAFPSCYSLLASMAQLLEGALILFPPEGDQEAYQRQIDGLYERAAQSEDLRIRAQVGVMRFYKLLNREAYAEAEALLDSLPSVSLDKNQMRANLCLRQGKLEEAAERLETGLLHAANNLQAPLSALLDIALQEGDQARAEALAEIARQAAVLFGLWDYSAYISPLQLAASRKDKAACLAALEGMLAAANAPFPGGGPLYCHVKPKADAVTVQREMLSTIRRALEADESLAFLRDDPAFLRLLARFQAD